MPIETWAAVSAVAALALLAVLTPRRALSLRRWLYSGKRRGGTLAPGPPPTSRSRTPVCFRRTIMPGETVTVRPERPAPDGFEADRLVVPTDAPRCFTTLSGHLQAPVSLTVRNDGTEPAVFEAALLGDTPQSGGD